MAHKENRHEVRKMWISKKKIQTLEKRVADLEQKVQGLPVSNFDPKEFSRQIQEHFQGRNLKFHP